MKIPKPKIPQRPAIDKLQIESLHRRKGFVSVTDVFVRKHPIQYKEIQDLIHIKEIKEDFYAGKVEIYGYSEWFDEIVEGMMAPQYQIDYAKNGDVLITKPRKAA